MENRNIYPNSLSIKYKFHDLYRRSYKKYTNYMKLEHNSEINLGRTSPISISFPIRSEIFFPFEKPFEKPGRENFSRIVK